MWECSLFHSLKINKPILSVEYTHKFCWASITMTYGTSWFPLQRVWRVQLSENSHDGGKVKFIEWNEMCRSFHTWGSIRVLFWHLVGEKRSQVAWGEAKSTRGWGVLSRRHEANCLSQHLRTSDIEFLNIRTFWEKISVIKCHGINPILWTLNQILFYCN